MARTKQTARLMGPPNRGRGKGSQRDIAEYLARSNVATMLQSRFRGIRDRGVVAGLHARRNASAVYLQSLARGIIGRRRVHSMQAAIPRQRVQAMPSAMEEKEDDQGNVIRPVRQYGAPSDDDYTGIALLDASAGGALQLIPAGQNSPYGQIVVRQEETGDISGSTVPILNFSVRIHVTDPLVDINNVQRSCLQAVQQYEQLFNSSSSNMSGTYGDSAYGQVRLLRMDAANMTNDLVTAMVPLAQLSDEFEVTCELFEQSENIIDPRCQHTLEFRYTFVFPAGAPITRAMVQNTTTAFRHQSSHRVNTNMGDTMARFIAMRNLRNSNGSRRLDLSDEMRQSALIEAHEERTALKLKVRRSGTKTAAKRRAAATREARVSLGLAAESEPLVPKRKLTADQKERYNAKRRQTYHEQHDTRGAYQDMKRRIFHHTSLAQYFEHSKAVLMVPNTIEEGLCMAMAIIRSEQRIYDLQTLDVFESGSSLHGTQQYRTFPLSERILGLLGDCAHYSFLAKNDEGTYDGALFNSFKPMRVATEEETESNGALKYCLDLSDEEIQCWYIVAQGFVEYILEDLKQTCLSSGLEYEEVDPNKEEGFLQAVCDVLDIQIGVYRAEVQGKRCAVYKPFYRDADVRKNTRMLEMVNVFITEDHASSVTNLRELVKNRASANRMHIQNFCLICEKVTTANNCNIEACKTHFKECLDKNDGEIKCYSESAQKKKYLKNYQPAQFFFDTKFRVYVCRTCRGELENGACQMEHVCYIDHPDTLDTVSEQDIMVYDFEAAQVEIPESTSLRHEVNLACCRNAYPHPIDGEGRRSFDTVEGFMEWVLSQTTKRRVYLAHNAGSYDVQFIMRYLEKNFIPHSFVPAPSSIHKYLSVTIPFGAGFSATFLDFRNFMPASLRNIGISFGLNLTKGDFPHHFNNGWRDLYDGRIPRLDDPRDFWCLSSKRTEKELEEFHTWYEEECFIFCTCEDEMCTCGKRSWNFKSQLLLYCWLDVDVLAEAVVKYRDNAMSFATNSNKEDNCGWEPKNIDPYSHLTIAQMAMKLLLSGLPEPQMLTITPNKVRTERSIVAIGWLEKLAIQRGEPIAHIGNSNKEYFCMRTSRYLDGYSRRSGTVYVCLNCDFHGCPSCFYQETQTGVDHPVRPGTYGAVLRDTKQFVEELYDTYGSNKVVLTWACEVDSLTEYELELGKIMKERDCFYGGRTEAFSPYTNAPVGEGFQIKYKDVCSLYPYVCARKRLPTGNPVHYCGDSIERDRLIPNAPNRYFGFVKCRVTPNPNDLLGLLPRRDVTSGRLEFPLHSWIGCFGTEELQLAIENGYVINEVYEVFHWSQEESSDTLLRGYISFFLRMKQEAEGWVKLGGSSENPTEEEKEELIEKVFEENGGIARIRSDLMQKNPTKRQLAKIFLNSLWGKFCQKPHKEHFITIHGYAQFVKVWFDPTVDRSSFSFRHLGGNSWKARYCTTDAYVKPNAKYNIYLAAKVTESARVVLHQEMLRIGPGKILYCDTDSLMYLCPESEIVEGHGLGTWVDEYPDERIVKLYVLAPKFYFLLKANGESLLKSKGVQLTLANSKRINEERLIQQILEVMYPVLGPNGEPEPFQSFIQVENMIMGVNSTNSNMEYGCMLTRYTEPKKVRPVFSKRMILTYPAGAREDRPATLDGLLRIFSLPKGFSVPVEEAAERMYGRRTH